MWVPLPLLLIVNSCPAFCQVHGHIHPWLWLTISECKHCYLFFSCFLMVFWFRTSSSWLWNQLHMERYIAARRSLWYTLTPLKKLKTPLQTTKNPNGSALPFPWIYLVVSVQDSNIFMALQYAQCICQNRLLSLSINYHDWWEIGEGAWKWSL